MPGRLEAVPAKRQFRIFVDYAHTDDALINVMKTLRELSPNRLIVVFGCGGNRDKAKRPKMAAAVDQLADWGIITSDNPRKEKPEAIIEDVQAGFAGATTKSMVDRREAIQKAVAMAQPRDIMLLAGKGHETYQEFADHTVPFDDVAVASDALAANPLEVGWKHEPRQDFRRNMEPTTLGTLSEWAGGQLLSGDSAQAVTTICTDSRALKSGDLFLALRGEKFDAHDFVPEAAKLDAVGVVVENAPADLPENSPVIRVADTLAALQQMAAKYRQTLGLKVVAITGSNGKTSTKDFTAAVLGEKFRVTKTEGNFNNHIGLPLTMLRASAQDEIGVFEIGMNHAGEIAPLAKLAAPDIAIITNIGMAHIEFMGTAKPSHWKKGCSRKQSAQAATLCFQPKMTSRTASPRARKRG